MSINKVLFEHRHTHSFMNFVWQVLANFLCKGPASKYLRLWEWYVLYRNYSTLAL